MFHGKYSKQMEKPCVFRGSDKILLSIILRHKGFSVFLLLATIVLPAISWTLYENEESYGLIWLFVHQIYYFPLGSWLGEPFFKPDSEVMFRVLVPGRVLTFIVYLSVILLARRSFAFMLSSKTGK